MQRVKLSGDLSILYRHPLRLNQKYYPKPGTATKSTGDKRDSHLLAYINTRFFVSWGGPEVENKTSSCFSLDHRLRCSPKSHSRCASSRTKVGPRNCTNFFENRSNKKQQSPGIVQKFSYFEYDVENDSDGGHCQVYRRWLAFLENRATTLLDEVCTCKVKLLLRVGVYLEKVHVSIGIIRNA